MAANIKDQVKVKKLLVGTQTPDVTTGKGVNTVLTNTNTSYFNADISALRTAGKELTAIRQLARANPDVSATVSAVVRIANSGVKYRVYTADHQLDPNGSSLLRSILSRMETQFDYTTGYDERQSIAGVVETLLRSVVLTGAAALELVLDKARLPYAIKPISVESLKFVISPTADGITQKIFPRVVSQKGNIDLDFPTIVYSALDFEPSSAYSYSPIEPAINTAIYHAEIVQDIRRSTERTGHSRLVVILDYESLLNNCPLDIRNDQTQFESWLEGIRQDVKQEIENLSPESAIVTYSNVSAEYLNSTIGAASDYTGLIEIINSILATSLKVPQSIIGKGNDNQNTASTESLIFLKQAEGLHQPVETVLSRALTLAVRLLGFDGYVKAEFNEIDLRPKNELYAFKMMQQQLVFERLSLGFYTDQEAAEILGTGELSPEFKPLSGTGFFSQGGQKQNEIPSTNGDPGRRALSTDQPKSAGGKDNAKR